MGPNKKSHIHWRIWYKYPLKLFQNLLFSTKYDWSHAINLIDILLGLFWASDSQINEKLCQITLEISSRAKKDSKNRKDEICWLTYHKELIYLPKWLVSSTESVVRRKFVRKLHFHAPKINGQFFISNFRFNQQPIRT